MEATEYKDRLEQAILRGNSRTHTVDTSGYPEDVAEVIDTVCELWYLRPPATKKPTAYWIQSSRELLDACREYGVEVIRLYRLDFEDAMRDIKRRTGQGCAPHVVEGPGSLVKMCRDKARQMREEAGKGENERNRYISGEYSDYINH